VTRRTDNTVNLPVLEALDVNLYKYSRDVRMKLAEFASKISYTESTRTDDWAVLIAQTREISKRETHP